MDFKIEENRIYLQNKNNEIIAQISFEKLNNNTYNVYHTYVDESLRGQGIANKLVAIAYEEITKNRKARFEATCEYVQKWLEKHNQN
jgi:predicted GNAT family acetyltransferase